MPNPAPTISLRLAPETRARLERARVRTRRSRSFLMQEALGRYLDDIEREQTPASAKLSGLMSLRGAGRRETTPRTTQEVDAHIRWLREND